MTYQAQHMTHLVESSTLTYSTDTRQHDLWDRRQISWQAIMPTTVVGSCTQLAYILSWHMFLLSIHTLVLFMCCNIVLLCTKSLGEEEEEKALASIFVYEGERETERDSP